MQPPCQTVRKSPSNYRAKRPQQNPCQLEFFHIEIESQHVALCYTSPSSCMGVERHTHAACLTRPLKSLAYPAYQACPYHPFLSLSSRHPMSTSPSYITATIATTNNVCILFPLSYLASHTPPFIGVVGLQRNDADRLTRPPRGPGLPSLPSLPSLPILLSFRNPPHLHKPLIHHSHQSHHKQRMHTNSPILPSFPHVAVYQRR